jgi:hypothetical protein
MYSLREAADVLGVRPRMLRKWLELGHFPGAVGKGDGEAKAWAIPHEAVTAFLRSSVQRQAHLDDVPVVAPMAVSSVAESMVPWHVVQHLLLTEAAQRQSWQALAQEHARSLETLRATLDCERDEIVRLRCELVEAREELIELRTRQACVEQSLPLEWNQHTRATQPISRAAVLQLVGEG